MQRHTKVFITARSSFYTEFHSRYHSLQSST